MKYFLVIICVFVTIVSLTLPTSAYDYSKLQEQIETEKLWESIPSNFKSFLPSDVSGNKNAADISENVDVDFFVSYSKKLAIWCVCKTAHKTGRRFHP